MTIATGSCGVSWSGGKDSCYALMKARNTGLVPAVLLNVLNEQGKITRSHGIPSAIIRAQAKQLGLPVHLISSSWADYERLFTAALNDLRQAYQLSHMAFGDIDLQAHRDWEEKVCQQAGLTAVLPLWHADRKQLILEMLDWGIETIIVSCNHIMGERFLGRQLSRELVSELERIGIDPCGENGEYHTLVTHCPLFKEHLNVQSTGAIKHDNYWFTNLQLSP
ncbi:diphthine--ammonia ligase [Segetibacter sp. 3557_3]|uniref:Dph6-related ATP pyrophosphatase n=1 Tax=Segetibacter sp. 3557_3 TaxID=2547429 RepID=UPI001058A79F|nr:diphthine--ammonia ligase [Segetibacter sp. 3557_3]TDH25616.1 diphthine--ammonia ligase [Segetibacter sp. 3557_3]